jgi:hypothetical protein
MRKDPSVELSITVGMVYHIKQRGANPTLGRGVFGKIYGP